MPSSTISSKPAIATFLVLLDHPRAPLALGSLCFSEVAYRLASGSPPMVNLYDLPSAKLTCPPHPTACCASWASAFAASVFRSAMNSEAKRLPSRVELLARADSTLVSATAGQGEGVQYLHEAGGVSSGCSLSVRDYQILTICTSHVGA